MKYAAALWVLLGALLVGCGEDDNGLRHVKYEVTGSAIAVDITFQNETGGTSQVDNETTPWTYLFSTEKGAFLFLLAQNQTDSGSVTVRILVDENPIEEATSHGAFVIASASGIAK